MKVQQERRADQPNKRARSLDEENDMNMLRRRKVKPMKVKDSEIIRSEAHKQFVRGFVCAIFDKAGHECEGKIECAHVRVGTDGGTSLKPSDCWCIPLCAAGHREQHAVGERSFETKYGIRMKEIAEKLWRISSAGIRYRKQKDPA